MSIHKGCTPEASITTVNHYSINNHAEKEADERANEGLDVHAKGFPGMRNALALEGRGKDCAVASLERFIRLSMVPRSP